MSNLVGGVMTPPYDGLVEKILLLLLKTDNLKGLLCYTKWRKPYEG